MSDRVSVVVPTYQRADVLARSLRSVAAQTHRPIQLVVVDDGSTDETRAVVEGFEATADLEVVYHRQENAGCAAARNRGLALADGEWVLFLDSDDALEPGAVAALLDAARGADAAFAYGPAVEVSAGGAERLNRPVAAGAPDRLATALFMDPNVRNGAVLFRTAVVRDAGGFDASLRHSEDTDLLQRVAAVHPGAYADAPTVRVHHHGSNKSRNRVAVVGALIRSASRALEEFPELAAALGPAGPARLRQLERQRVRALVLRGDFQEAAASPAHARRALDRLCIRLGTTLPARAWAWARVRLGRPAVA